MQTHCEAAGPSFPGLRDALQNYGNNDIVMTEFWGRIPGSNRIRYVNNAVDLASYDDLKTAASAANVYGKRIVQTESFTLTDRKVGYKNYTRSFWELKDVCDRAFCQGVNRHVLCLMVAQPAGTKAPGYTNLHRVGFEFTRLNSYWPMGKAWIDYMRRCQHLLQQGETVSDFLYFHGNRVPVNMPAKFLIKPAKPEGTDADLVNNHALMTRASVRENRVTFPDGQSYRYLVMRQGTTDALTPATLGKLLELVTAGATLIGPAPQRPFGYEGFPESDTEFERLRAKLWPSKDGAMDLGEGRVIQGKSLAEVMKMDELAPDLEIVEDPATAALPESVMGGIPGPGFDYIHRRTEDLDIYFIANLRNARAAGRFTFRANKRPQIWEPVDGSIWSTEDYRTVGNRTTIELNFEPRQSLFVIFGSKAKARNAYHNNRMVAGGEIEGSWNVAFDTEWGGPGCLEFKRLIDWTTHPDNGVKYYSGTGAYTKSFDLPAKLKGGGKPVYLDLGEVQDMAEVTLNGVNLGVVWCKPFQVEITGAVKDAGNNLKVAAVNRWSNRMLGDKVLSEDYMLRSNASHASKPIPAGLLGPVRLLASER